MIGLVISSLVVSGCLVWLVRHWWRERKFVPKSRVRHMRMRLHMRRRPGKGFATTFELWLRWGRFATWRRSKSIRPSVPSLVRLAHPETHSVKLGTAQYGHALRVPMEQHLLLVSGPRTGKSALISALLMHYPGAAVVTSSRQDLFQVTSGIRAQLGPVELFDPQGFAGTSTPSTVRFNPVEGAEDEQVAIRRAGAFANAVSMEGTENGGYFAAKSAGYFRALFHAAALTGGDLRLVARWVFTSAEPAERILAAAGHEDWARELAELRGPAEKANATVKSVMATALNFMHDPQLAQAVLPGEFHIRRFLESKGTIYMVAAGQSKDSPMSPVFACLASEIHYEASLLASTIPGGRLDPPLGMFMDELCQVCPVPIASWLSDSGGRGIQIVSIAHSWSQLAGKFGEHDAQTIFETSGVKVLFPGVTDTSLLERFSKLSGQFSQRARYQDHHSMHDVATADMVRSMPDGRAFIIQGNKAPVIGRMERGYKQPTYRLARREGEAVAVLQAPAPVPSVAAAEYPAVDTDQHELVEAELVTEGGDWR